MCGALDAIRKLVEQAVTGEPSGIDADRIIEQLASQDAPISNAEGDVPFSVENTAQEPLANDGGPYRIETIRVEPHKLDALMTQTTELMVTKTLIAHRAVQTDRIVKCGKNGSDPARRFAPKR